MRILPSVAVMEKKVFKNANAADIPTSDARYLPSNEEKESLFSERQMLATVNCSRLTDFDGVL